MIRILLVLLLAAPAAAQTSWQPSLAKALASAKAAKRRVLADFTAPWCYSCYYMEKNVLDRAPFWELARGLELARIDVDRPEGKAAQERHKVRFLPTFIVFDEQGREVGRILGEQRETDFLARLKGLLGPAAGTPEDAAVATLAGLLSREENGAAAAFARKPAPASQEALAQRADWRVLEARVRHRAGASPEALETLLSLDDSCELSYDLLRGVKAAERERLAASRRRLETWAERRFWVPRDIRCADFRSGVEAMAEVYSALGDEAARKTTLDRAATVLVAESERAGLAEDRNLADTRRYFLEAAGRDAELEQLFGRLVEAYPSDYVYPYRFAKWLLGKKRAADALPWIEKADRLCYGANRLMVTKVHAEVLRDLGRAAEAAKLLRRDINAYGKSLPKETKPLAELLASLRSGATPQK